MKMKTSKKNVIYDIVLLAFLIGVFLIIPIIKARDIPIYKNSNIYIYMQSVYKDQKALSFWTKTRYSNGYTLSEINLDCKNHSFSTKSYNIYDLNNKLVNFKQNNLYRFQIVLKYKQDKHLKDTLMGLNHLYKTNSKTYLEIDNNPLKI